MQGPGMGGHAQHHSVERPPNYLARSLILAVLLVPLSLLLGVSKLWEVFQILTGPLVRSESPVWWRALMELLKALVGIIGVFVPLIAIAKSLRVNAAYNSGDYLGAESASRKASSYSKQSIIYLIMVLLVIATDFLRFIAF